VGVGILLLCAADAILTLTLISHGAVELNPLMAPLVKGSGHSFAYWKMGLIAMGVVVLTLLARVRFGARRSGPSSTWSWGPMPSWWVTNYFFYVTSP